MEMTGVVQERVVGSEVCTTAEPPHRTGFEVAVVEMDRGDVGIAGVQDHGGTGGEPGVPLRLGSLLEDRGRQLLSLNLREIHAALLENAAFAHHARSAATALGSLPAFLHETALAIQGFQPGTDFVLEAHDHRACPLTGVLRRELQ